jgi:hypothetical protein
MYGKIGILGILLLYDEKSGGNGGGVRCFGLVVFWCC